MISKVSVIMPAYNVENYIEASIESVLNQTYNNWELIIIDDGSTDKTAEICKRYADLDDRIIYLYQENSKQAKARNNGIGIAKGDIIAFLDADDLWLPNKLELSLLYFDTNKFDLIFTDAYFGNNSDLEVANQNLKKMNIPESEYFGNNAIADFIKFNRIPILTVLLKKKCVEEVNFFDESCVPAEDYDLWLRLLKKGYKFQSISIPLSIYRVQESSSTSLDRLVTDLVLKSIMKNFDADELQQLDVAPFIKNWIIRWIKLYLTKSNMKQFKMMLNHFKYKKLTVRISVMLGYLVSFNIFKRLILKVI